MTPILDRIRANGGEAVRDKWEIRLRAGRLSPAALAWIRSNKERLMQEVWPEYDQWVERAAIMEFDGNLCRSDAGRAAYAEITGC